MIDDQPPVERPPLLLCLHALGASGRAWDLVGQELKGVVEMFAPDLPGFAHAADAGPRTVAEMVDWAAAQVRQCRPARWLVAGHSMGGKLAMLLAARAEAHEPGLGGFLGTILVAASPLEPEPMDEARRAAMIAWAKDGAISADDARRFVDANVAAPLPAAIADVAAADVRRADPQAWTAWLERGSREDWSDGAQPLRTPLLVVAGVEDGDLGPPNQRRLNLPRGTDATYAGMTGAAHLIPLEKPAVLAMLIAGHAARAAAAAALPPTFSHLLASPRVSRRTRAAMVARLAPPSGEGPFGPGRRALLRALLARVVPQRGTPLDLAAIVEDGLAAGEGDGWRFADLPADLVAWRAGLDTLDALAPDFATLPGERQDAWLERLAAGSADVPARDGQLTAAQMRLWFEDVRGEAVRAWLAHPATMARIGYDGFAVGGDGPRIAGYARFAAGEIEAWQPRPTEA